MVLFSLELFSISGSLYSCITAQDLIFDYLRLSVAQISKKRFFFFFLLSTSAGYIMDFQKPRHAMKVISNKMQKKVQDRFPR